MKEGRVGGRVKGGGVKARNCTGKEGRRKIGELDIVSSSTECCEADEESSFLHDSTGTPSPTTTVKTRWEGEMRREGGRRREGRREGEGQKCLKDKP